MARRSGGVRHYARRVDRNQKEIAEALRAVGATVVHLQACENGVPDLLVGRFGVTYLLEIKRERGPRGGNNLTGGKSMAATSDRQALFRERWRGGDVVVVRSVQEALDATLVLG